MAKTLDYDFDDPGSIPGLENLVSFQAATRMRVDRFIKWTVFCFVFKAATRMRVDRFIKYTVFCFFFSFSTSVVGTSGFAPSATSGPLILPVLGKI